MFEPSGQARRLAVAHFNVNTISRGEGARSLNDLDMYS